MIPWTQKYSPKKLAEIAGQPLAVSAARNFVLSFSAAKRKALLLFGPSGVGKTCIVKALAEELNCELVEMNASQFRDAGSVQTILGPATKQASLFGTKKVILVDDADSLSGMQDRGGPAAIAEIIETTKFPIILTATDAYNEKLKSVRQVANLVELKQITQGAIEARLKGICAIENVKCDEIAIRKLAAFADGDLRAAINDLQMLSSGKSEIKDVDIELFGREKESELFDVLKLVFNAKNTGQIFDKFDYLDLELKDFLLWLEDGVTKEYSYLQEFAYAYENLADADIFLHRIMRRQHWRFFVYAKLLALAGVNRARISANKKFVSYGTYGKPDLLLKIWSMAAKRKKMQGIAEQTSNKMHTSARRIQQAFWKYYEFIQEKNPKYAEGIAEGLGLEV
jgi:replication factor C large subunit